LSHLITQILIFDVLLNSHLAFSGQAPFCLTFQRFDPFSSALVTAVLFQHHIPVPRQTRLWADTGLGRPAGMDQISAACFHNQFSFSCISMQSRSQDLRGCLVITWYECNDIIWVQYICSFKMCYCKISYYNSTLSKYSKTIRSYLRTHTSLDICALEPKKPLHSSPKLP
jgi:hypothetical protein